MITSLKGTLIFKGNNSIALDVHGVGFEIYVSRKVIENLPSLNNEYSVLTYLDVKENSLMLYGFYDERERELFKLLTTVNGISSKSAHTILSYAGFEDIVGLITNRNALSGLKIPGIGAKKIELISVALKDKIFKLSESYIGSERGTMYEPGAFSKEQSRLDALNALINLGYIRSEAERIIREVLKSNAEKELTTEELIKKSLEFTS
jgi:holliday junction DNA helicase RuvA